MTLTNTLRFSLMAAALITSTAMSAKAHAANTDTHTIVVNYADLNLAKKAGVDALRHRLVMASREVCGGSAQSLSEAADYEQCRNEAVQNALHDLRQAVAAANVRSNYAVANAAPN